MKEEDIQKLSDLEVNVVNAIAREQPAANICDIQQAFWKVILNMLALMGKGKDIPFPKAYLIRSVRNEVIAALKQQARTVSYEEENLSNTLVAPDNLLHQIQLQEAKAALNEILAECHYRDRWIFKLRAIHEWSFLEISEVFGIEEGHARVIFHRVRKKLSEDERLKDIC